MGLSQITNLITRQEWLDEPAKKVQSAVRRVYEAAGPAGERARNFLNGLWLGHPLHPVITDVPLGAWSAAALLDAIEMGGGQRTVGQAADRAVALGVAAALAAATAGATDWHPLRGQDTRRVGIVHAALNVTATLLYGASLLARRGGKRGAGRALAFAGYAVITGGAFLGGELSYRLRAGMNHASGIETPQDFVAVIAEANLPDRTLQRLDANGTPVVLYREDDRIYALVEVCAHRGGPLAGGHVDDGCVVCPWHGSKFELDGGQVRRGPSAFSQPALEVRIRDGQIEVRG